MIMLRSNNTTKTKPPPPVPPRPSKSIVAEALAKSRKPENIQPPKPHAAKPILTIRNANPVIKSQSYSSINNNYKNIIPHNIERSISEEDKPKPATRTLVYQSSNLLNATKKGSIEEIRVNVTRNISIKRENNNAAVSRTSSFKSTPVSRNNSFIKSENNVLANTNQDNNKKVLIQSLQIDKSNQNKTFDGVIETPFQQFEVAKTFQNHIEVGRLVNNKPFDMVVSKDRIIRDNISKDSSLESLIESVDDVKLSRSSSFQTNELVSSLDSVLSDDLHGLLDDNSDEINDRNHVNTLIDEMFASVLDIPDDKETDMVQVINDNVILPDDDKIRLLCETELIDSDCIEMPHIKTTLVVDNCEESKKVRFENEVVEIVPPIDLSPIEADIIEEQPKIDDKFNHELLISELACMKHEQNRILKRQRKPSLDLYDNAESKIQHSDWVEVNNGEEVRLSSCQITIENAPKSEVLSRFDEMSNLHGLPPLPKSLSGFNLIESPQTPGRPGSSRNISPATHARSSSNESSLKKGSNNSSSNLDAKLALLRREMYSLRQLDLSLLSQLWSLNESIQDFRHILQDQDERSILSPPSPSPTPSSGEDGDGDEFYTPSPIRFRPAPPPPPQRRPSNSSSGTGSSV